MNWNWHRNKREIRDFVLPDKPISSGIWLPAQDWLCVLQAIHKGLLKNCKSILAVERDPDIFCKMVQNAPNHPAIQCVNGKLENTAISKSVDYCYLDFLGGFSKPVSLWMERTLSPKLQQDATVVITQIYASRGSKIIPDQAKLLFSDEGLEISRRYESFFGEIDRHMKCLLILIHRIFNGWEFDIEVGDDNRPPIYKDLQHKMIVFKLVGFKKSKTLFSPLGGHDD